MIQSKQDLKHYLLEDRKAQHKILHPSLKQRIVEWLFPDYNYEFTKCLRYLEYFTNCNNILWGGVKRIYFMKKLSRLRAITGIELNPNCADSGLHIVHGKIVVHLNAKIGKDCKILSDVTIGWQGRYDKPGAPQIGDRVFIGSGAKIIGNITIASDVVIGANAVVVHSINEPGVTVAGNPAKKVSDTDSYYYLNKE